MPTPEDRQKARARLALRAERAMGVKSIRGKLERVTGGAIAPVRRDATARAVDSSTSVQNPRLAPRRPFPPTPVAPIPAVQPPTKTTDAPLIPDPVFTGPVLSTEQKTLALQTLDATQVKGCTKCRLCETRTQTVFGEGSVDARVMFIGEGPGENEDLSGRPFVGRAGQLLDKMISAMGLSRESVYICNIVKCRPPENRQPAADETAACTPYLLEQVMTIRPQVIVTLGLPSTQYILKTKNSMSKLRGTWHDWRGIKVLPTYHPAYVLRQYTPQTREAVWGDLKMVLAELNLPIPMRSGS